MLDLLLEDYKNVLIRDACMTWTLDNGTIVMQNFVDSQKVKGEGFIVYFTKRPGPKKSDNINKSVIIAIICVRGLFS